MRKLSDCFNNDILKICTKVTEITTLNQQVKKYLSTELAAHCRATHLENGCLVLSVDNQSWATQLRYETPELLKSLRIEEKMYALRSIKQQIVAPLVLNEQPVYRKKLNMSLKSYEIVYGAAAKCEDPGLQQALLKLSRTIKEMAE